MATVTFNIKAETSFGDKIVIVGGGDALGNWDPVSGSLELTTTEKDYPRWKSAAVTFENLDASIEYKYVRLKGDGEVQWEFDGSNRYITQGTIEGPMVMDDGDFGYLPTEQLALPQALVAREDRAASFDLQPSCEGGPRIVVLGDDVALGHGAKGYEGWAAQLGKKLHETYGYGFSNISRLRLCALEASKQGLASFLPTPTPEVVIIAFSLELQWLATCPDWDRGNIAENNLKALVSLVAQAWELGTMPVVAGLCPNSAFQEEQAEFLRSAENAMKRLGAPVLDWLHLLTQGGEKYGTWNEKLAHGSMYPNTAGHACMLSAIDLQSFEPSKVKARLDQRSEQIKTSKEQVCFEHGKGFEIRYCCARQELIISNSTDNEYTLNPDWGELQASMAKAFEDSPWALRRGMYLRSDVATPGALFSAFIGEAGALESGGMVPARTTVRLRHVGGDRLEGLPEGSCVLFTDGKLAVVKTADARLRVLNSASCDYNIHPMWYDVRQATKVMKHGVYEDDSGLDFRTAVISCHGLQSRVKIPKKSAIELRWVGDLKSIEQIAVLPLGDRCSIRMLLHKIEFDGPCYPFDLTRTTSLADVADIVASGFSDMWNADYLYYEDEAGRVFHRKWGGLSFAHEVEYENGDDPIGNFGPIAQRMVKRYTGRAARFDYACRHADRVMFMRTGNAERNEVSDLMSRLEARFPGLNASLLLISDQDSGLFSGLKNVTHVRESFDPDRMYDDLNYWMNSAHQFRGILQRVGITARNLYWCPNNLKEAEEEKKAAVPKAADVEASVPKLTSEVKKFSHSNLYRLTQDHSAAKDHSATKEHSAVKDTLKTAGYTPTSAGA
eukprot:TRINITY_DN12181_c0_g1_i1.p1 TRINITY_DN12181_c0_g1~~TRINITY_DN12181_c0_g1_i1.p1  ORF type:complete len:868 (+),score=173.84 TRINITY_DN12181_c0_g1_i1:87-2606(+)